jgi:hypothetical protein
LVIKHTVSTSDYNVVDLKSAPGFRKSTWKEKYQTFEHVVAKPTTGYFSKAQPVTCPFCGRKLAIHMKTEHAKRVDKILFNVFCSAPIVLTTLLALIGGIPALVRGTISFPSYLGDVALLAVVGFFPSMFLAGVLHGLGSPQDFKLVGSVFGNHELFRAEEAD